LSSPTAQDLQSLSLPIVQLSITLVLNSPNSLLLILTTSSFTYKSFKFLAFEKISLVFTFSFIWKFFISNIKRFSQFLNIFSIDWRLLVLNDEISKPVKLLQFSKALSIVVIFEESKFSKFTSSNNSQFWKEDFIFLIFSDLKWVNSTFIKYLQSLNISDIVDKILLNFILKLTILFIFELGSNTLLFIIRLESRTLVELSPSLYSSII